MAGFPWKFHFVRFVTHVLAAHLVSMSLPSLAVADVEIAPFAGFRLGGDIDLRDRASERESRLELDEGGSFGLVVNLDLAEPGKQAELYIARHDTKASSILPFAGDTTTLDLMIYQVQVGGLYFPGGQTSGGFVSGVAGVTRLEPKDHEFDSHHRASISLGGGYKLPLTDQLLVRFDLRGIYTVLDSGGAVFCSGGCSVRFESSGYFQGEVSAGLAFRF